MEPSAVHGNIFKYSVDREKLNPYSMRFLSGAIAQLGERLHGMQEVGGSIPPSSTKNRKKTVLGPHRLEA